MQIVIDIDEKLYNYIQTDEYNEHLDKRFDYQIRFAVKDSIPLPKEHGRLGDLDALEKEMINGIKAGNYEDGYDNYSHINNMDDCVECVKYADTIIEADKAEEIKETTEEVEEELWR